MNAPGRGRNRRRAPSSERTLGAGLITGAADDDPSGIATYSQAGAQFGYAMLWTVVLTFPLMAAIQLVSARIGLVTRRGLADNIKASFPRPVLLAVVALLVVANTINIAADIAAMGEALRLVWGARHGLSESELLDLLGENDQPLPRANWTPFYLVADRSLALRAGLLNFGHDYLREAVREELLAGEEDRHRPIWGVLPFLAALLPLAPPQAQQVRRRQQPENRAVEGSRERGRHARGGSRRLSARRR